MQFGTAMFFDRWQKISTVCIRQNPPAGHTRRFCRETH